MSYPAAEINGELRVKVGDRWRKGEEQVCLECGRVFFKPSGLIGGQGIYCTKMCMSKAAAKRNQARRPEKICVICHQPFKIQKAHINRVKTCGKPECKSALARLITIARYQKEGRELKTKISNYSELLTLELLKERQLS